MVVVVAMTKGESSETETRPKLESEERVELGGGSSSYNNWNNC